MLICNSLFYFYVMCNVLVDCSVLQVVLKYFESKNIGAVNSFICQNSVQQKVDSTLLMTESLISIPRKEEDIAFMLRAQHHVIGIVADLSCPHTLEILDMISRHRLFNNSYAVALIAQNVETQKTLTMLERFRISLDSDIVIFTSEDIVEVHRIKNNWPLIFSSVGNWDSSGELNLTIAPPRWNLNGTTIKAVSVVKEFDIQLFGAKEFFDFNYHPTVDGLSRHMCSISRYMEFMNNFRTDLTPVPDWGYLNETTGGFNNNTMFGLLEREETELGLTASWLNSKRARVGVFAPTFHSYSSSIVFRHPPAGTSISALAKPLSLGSWLIMFMFVFFQLLCLYSIRRSSVADEPAEDKLSSSLLQICGIFCLQGVGIDSNKIPTRILSLTIQVMALMMYSYYGATIVGFLLLPTPRTITSVDRLLDTSIDLWVENTSFHKQHFKSVVAAMATKYYEEGIKKKNKFIDRTIGLQMVQKGGAALYGVATSLHDVIRGMFKSSEICSLQYLDVLNTQSTFAIMKRSPYREVFLRSLIRLVEHGFSDYEEKKWHAQRPTCVGSEANAAVKLEATFIALMIFTAGLLLALSFFAIELLHGNRTFKKGK